MFERVQLENAAEPARGKILRYYQSDGSLHE